MRGRLQKDDFVVDDGVGGYMDNGMDDFGDGDEAAESDEEIDTKKKRACCDGAYLTTSTDALLQPRRKGKTSQKPNQNRRPLRH